MKKHVLPKPAAPNMAVSVPSLTPEFGLLCLQPVDRYTRGQIRPVYGGNMAENSIYTNGTTSKHRRSAADFEQYESELIIQPLPDLIEEINPEDYPGTYQLIITNGKVIELPEAKPEPETCKVIEHPAAWFARAKKHKVKHKDDNQLFLFHPSDEVSDLTRKSA